MSKSCSDCIYLGIDKNVKTICRINPPVEFVLGFDGNSAPSTTMWPKVDRDNDWCGKHEYKTSLAAVQ